MHTVLIVLAIIGGLIFAGLVCYSFASGMEHSMQRRREVVDRILDHDYPRAPHYRVVIGRHEVWSGGCLQCAQRIRDAFPGSVVCS